MKGKRHIPEQIIAKLREADAMLGAGRTIGQVVQHLAVSEQTYSSDQLTVDIAHHPAAA